jgi:hypothetical protein
MYSNGKAVLGVFRSRSEVEPAVRALKYAGFENPEISVLLPDLDGTHADVHTHWRTAAKGTTLAGAAASTGTGSGAITGAGAGAALGGTLGLLIGIGVFAVPSVGPLIAAGPIIAALAGVGVGGALGGVTGALVGIGVPEKDARRYEALLKTGRILISLHTRTSAQVRQAKACLEETGAENILVAEITDGEPELYPNQHDSLNEKEYFSG